MASVSSQTIKTQRKHGCNTHQVRLSDIAEDIYEVIMTIHALFNTHIAEKTVVRFAGFEPRTYCMAVLYSIYWSNVTENNIGLTSGPF